MNKYKTVAGKGTAETEEKKSKFIAHVFPVEDEEAAAGFISNVRKKHYNATHNVFAYSIGISGEIIRASDDGEPSGTAGMPILNILTGEKIRNTLIVVTRYFGGTLLGTGGLVRAYGNAAKEGLISAGIIERTLCVKYELSVDYHLCGKIQYTIEEEGYELLETIYTDIVTFILLIDAEKKERFLNIVSELCQGGELIDEIETDYFDLRCKVNANIISKSD